MEAIISDNNTGMKAIISENHQRKNNKSFGPSGQKGERPGGDAAEEEAAFAVLKEPLRGKLLRGREEIMKANGLVTARDLEELAKAYDFSFRELTEAYHYGGSISPELWRALDMEETSDPRHINRAIRQLTAAYTEKAMKLLTAAYTEKAMKLLKARVLAKAYDSTSPITMEGIERRYFNPLYSAEVLTITDPIEKHFDKHSKQHSKSGTSPFAEVVGNKIGDDHNLDGSKSNGPESSSKAHDHMASGPNHSQMEIDIESLVPKNPIIEAAKINHATYNKMFVSIISQAAVGVMTSGSVDPSILKFFAIVSVAGFLASLWAMYLQKNPKWEKFLSKIGALASTWGIIFALTSSFADERYLNAYLALSTLGCIITGVLIMIN